MSNSCRTTNTLAKAMILAAGRGERMRPLTDLQPKPLLEVRGKALIEWQLLALAQAGFQQLVINTAWLGHQISDRFGIAPTMAGQALSIAYSHEGLDFGDALETAGGVVRALPLLDEVFWVLAADIYTPDFVYSPDSMGRFAASDKLAHLWLVPNPPHHPAGDFGLGPDGLALDLAAGSSSHTRYTFSTIGLYRREFFATVGIEPGNPLGIKAPLAPLLRAAMGRKLVSAELYLGAWTDVGTPQRLSQLN